jgi:IS605 OrfB family transposase
VITYNTELLTDNQEDLDSLKSILESHRVVFNIASKEQFNEKKNSIVILHSKVYHPTRKQFPEINSQVIIKAEQECLAMYRSAKSNKHKIKKPIEKKNLSIRLDKRLYSFPTNKSIKITTSSGKKHFKFKLYPKLVELLNKYKYKYADPLLYVNDNKIYISLPFDNKIEKQKSKLALGVDLGMRRVAACSDGRIIIDRKFNGDKRKLRHLKDSLKSEGTKSARRHLLKLRHKEANKNKNQTHCVANEILKTNCDTIVLENLKGIKAKKHKFQNKRAISQVPLFELRRILTYKAENMGKSVILVSPAYTSQIDSFSGIKEGVRRGCRFYALSGIVYDADLNASRNIGNRSKLPVSYGNILDGQATVNSPIVCKSSASREVLQAPTALA